MAIKPVDYKQYDSRWAYNDYSVAGKEKTNIYVSGCGPTSVAMIIAALADASVTPATCAAWSVKNGYKAVGAGTYNTYFVPQLKAYGIACEYLSQYCYHNSAHANHAKAKAALKAGKWLIANVGPGLWTSGGHFIVVYDIDKDDNVYIYDPASTKAARLKNKFSTLAYQTKYWWIIEVPENAQQPVQTKNYLEYGDTGEDVGVAQKMLKELGHYTGKIDKSFGPLMLEAVKAAQKVYNLATDGYYGPLTQAAVEKAYAAKIAAQNTKTYNIGSNYKLKYDLKVRNGASTKYAWKKRSELTANAKKHAYDQTYAVLKAGTVVTVQQVTKLSNGEIWVKIPSGWVCAVQGGKVYIA